MAGSWISPVASGTFVPLSPQATVVSTPPGGNLLLEDGSALLLEDGTHLLLEGGGSATYVSTRSGSWSSPATWGGAGTPSSGDTATIAAVGSPVSGAADNGSGVIRLTVGSTANWSTGQYASVAGVVGTAEANGLWRVTVVDGTHMDLQGSAFANAYASGGNANCVVVVDVPVVVGSKTITVGHAIRINGTGSTQYGCLIVSGGFALTLRGMDWTDNALMIISRYGLFAPQPGSTVLGDVPSDFASGIINNGRLEAIGTSGSRITLSVPSGNVNWGATGGGSTATGVAYDRGASIMSIPLADPAISNVAGTGIGSLPDTSMTFASITPAGILTSEVSSLAGVNGVGKYYVDYDAGCIYCYNAAFGATSVTPSYKRLDKSAASWRGWGIVSSGSTSYNTCLVDYCDFRYMGGVSASYALDGQASMAPLTLSGHQTSAKAGNSSRLAYVKHSTFNQCVRWIRMAAIDGGSASDLFQVSGNTFNDGSNPTASTYGIHAAGGYGVNYVSIGSNAFNTRAGAVDSYPTSLKAADASSGDSNVGWSVTNNTGCVGTTFVRGRNAFVSPDDPDEAFATPDTPGLYVGGNDIRGWGATSAPDTRLLVEVGGTSEIPAIVENNHFHHCARLGNLGASYATFRDNRFGLAYRQGFAGANLDDRYVTDVSFVNNLFYCDRGATGTSSTSACVSIGNNKRVVSNNLVVASNTVDGWLNGVLDFNDTGDSAGPTLASNVVAVNNIVANGGYAFSSYTSASQPARLHVTECDFNNTSGQATAYARSGANALTNGTNPTNFFQGANKYNRTASGSRNIPCVALFDASYSTAQSARSLAYTVTTLGQDHTLAWGSGSPVQLIYDYGTSAGQGLRTVAVAGKTAWPTNVNAIRQNWLWVVSGTGAGQARAITWATANAAYAATVASGGSGYSSGQYVRVSGGTTESTGPAAICKITAVSGGAATTVQVVSGGTYSSPPSNAAATARITGSTGTGLTLNLSWAPGLMLVPDLATAVDSTSVLAIVNAYVRLGDGASGTVGAGLYLPVRSLSPWSFFGNSGVSGINSGFTISNPPAPEGSQVAFLQNFGSFSQDISGWAGGSYTLSFKAAQRGNNQTAQQDFAVLVDGVVVSTFTPSGSSYQDCTTASFSVAAGTHTIKFQGLNSAGGDNTAFIDQVSVSPTGPQSVGDSGFEQVVAGYGNFKYLNDTWKSSVQIPTTTQTDSGITVVVSNSPTGNPGFTGSGLSSIATDYKWSGTSARGTATTDNLPGTDYFGGIRSAGGAPDIGFFELLGGGIRYFQSRMTGGFFDM